jgi:hypothetical protein
MRDDQRPQAFGVDFTFFAATFLGSGKISGGGANAIAFNGFGADAKMAAVSTSECVAAKATPCWRKSNERGARIVYPLRER